MLRLSKLTDYAIVLLGHFVHEQSRSWTARHLAEAARLPMPTVSKVLKLLARAGLLGSQRGVAGGYVLTREARSVTVAEVIAAVDGPIAITECVASTCDLESSCNSRPHWHHINRAVASALAGITIHDMTHPAPERLVQLGARRANP